jgi:hypothetical protein
MESSRRNAGYHPQPSGHAYLIDVIYDGIHDLALERLVDDRPVTRNEFSLSTPYKHHSFPNVDNVDHSDDVAKLSGACPWAYATYHRSTSKQERA